LIIFHFQKPIFLPNILNHLDIHQLQYPILTPLPQLKENPFDKMIQLDMHVIESDADKDTDGLPGCEYV